MAPWGRVHSSVLVQSLLDVIEASRFALLKSTACALVEFPSRGVARGLLHDH